MKLAVTGCNGSVGRRVVQAALKRGYSVVGIDYKQAPLEDTPAFTSDPKFTFREVDLKNYDKALEALREEKAEAIVQLAAVRTPEDYVVVAHNTNVVISWNILRAAAELGIKRVAQASSVNVITLVWSQGPILDYFPLDEDHPCRPDEPYGLSKLQADTIIRRYPFMRVASLRLSWSLSNEFKDQLSKDPIQRKNDLWGWVNEDSGAEAFLLALDDSDKWDGHEAFFITAPDTVLKEESEGLRQKFWPNVPMKQGKELIGNQGFFDCSKAERLLGWVHQY
ncbi:NAD(P)-binding protein [Cristinia sonorae]|uniref:NAD(P)-binding protein n=1 Tax=Cristinia sonorae TaxID=1940300 RepID=A0A8K0UNU0_9AGAR|nr:NAD(P)-binding protein [Cristinia sonorae]